MMQMLWMTCTDADGRGQIILKCPLKLCSGVHSNIVQSGPLKQFLRNGVDIGVVGVSTD